MALEPTWTVSRGEKSLAASGPGRSRPKRSGGQEKSPKTGPQHCPPSNHPRPVRTVMMTPLSRPHPSLCQLHGWHFLQNHDILNGEETFMGFSPTDLHGNWGPQGEKKWPAQGNRATWRENLLTTDPYPGWWVSLLSTGRVLSTCTSQNTPYRRCTHWWFFNFF